MSFSFDSFSKKLQDVAAQTSSKFNETVGNFDFNHIQEKTTSTFDKTSRIIEEKTNTKNIDITQYPEEYTSAVQKFKHYEELITKTLNFTNIVDSNDHDLNVGLSNSLKNIDVQDWKASISNIGERLKTTTNDLINNGTLTNAHFDNKADKRAYGFDHTFSAKVLNTLNLLKDYPEDEFLRMKLLEFSNMENSLGDLKLIKNEVYKSEFNLSLNTILATKFEPIHKSIKKVEDYRLTYDIQRSKILEYTKRHNSSSIDQSKLEEMRTKLNTDEDAFATSIENTISKISSLFDELTLLEYFKKIVQAELEYHKNSVKLIESFDF
ncbi:hypothetical protein QEN19_001377 [Hanseniaspora menglaensis]